MDINAIAHNLFKKHEGRYLIYDMEGKRYAFLYKGIKTAGLISEAKRDVFKNKIHLFIDGKKYEFREPTYITMDGKDVVFTYAIDSNAIDEDDLRTLETTEHRFKSMD